MPPARRNCKFTKKLSQEFPFIKSTKFGDEVTCTKCQSTFSITSGGRRDITRHLACEKHKKHINAAASSSVLTNYYRNDIYGTCEKKLAISEALFAYHAVAHNHSFRSMDCTSKIIQKRFENKFSCARTKSEAIIKRVLAPFAFDALTQELETSHFVSIFSDASDHKDIKLFPTLLDKNNLKNKLVAYCADNANTNFGGVSKKGNKNVLVFNKLKQNVPQKLIDIGCAAHIIHNTLQTAADLLPVDVDSVINKKYSHFYIFTVRIESLKTFCEEAETDYHKLLSTSKTRWLSLRPAIERILQLYAPLKSYFLSLEKCPAYLSTFFFSNNASEIWLKFVHCQASLFSSTIKMIENYKCTVTEVAKAINNPISKLEARLDQTFIPLIIRTDLTKLTEEGEINKECQFSDIGCLEWTDLNQCVEWENVQKTLEFISEHFTANDIDESALFDEVTLIKNYATEQKIKEWQEMKTPIDLRWLLEFALCLPATNAPTERVFSIINNVWTPEKSQLTVETLKAMIVVRCNLGGSCEEFLLKIQDNSGLLKKVHSAEKYI
ncbi:hypothetical protein ILUMI_00548 [Ignelater luminosus]|uniref:HAT C-terminal dimerisation domain-containing protein n=1 Tax=Ignelater luminosus TaxID=2038154 RepID=A0A8K0DM31_IGNLU|nr:hypothetical protein ILUMI_00548 [Ignelater luminosus]